MSAQQRITELRKELDRLNHAYYVENSPLSSYYDYDMMIK